MGMTLKGNNGLWITLACVAVVVIIVIFLIFRIRILSEKLASLYRDNTQRLTAEDVLNIVRQYGRPIQQQQQQPAPPACVRAPPDTAPEPPSPVMSECDEQAEQLEQDVQDISDTDEDPVTDLGPTAEVLDDEGQATGELLQEKKVPEPDPVQTESEDDGQSSVCDHVSISPGLSPAISRRHEDDDAGKSQHVIEFRQRMQAEAQKAQEEYLARLEQRVPSPSPTPSPSPPASPPPAKPKRKPAAKRQKKK